MGNLMWKKYKTSVPLFLSPDHVREAEHSVCIREISTSPFSPEERMFFRTQWDLLSFYNLWPELGKHDLSIWSLTRVKWWVTLYTGFPHRTRGATLTRNLLKTPTQQPSVIINQSKRRACWRCEQTQMEIQQQQALRLWRGHRQREL